MADKKDEKKLSASDVQLLLAQMAQALANTPGTMAGAQTAFEGARNTAASEYQDKVAKEQEKAKKGNTLATIGKIGGLAGSMFIPGLGAVTGPLVASAMSEAGGAAGHLAAGEQIDPMAALANIGIGTATGYGLGKVAEFAKAGEAVANTAQVSGAGTAPVGTTESLPVDAPLVPSNTPANQWAGVNRTARVDSRQVAEAPMPEDAPLVPSPAPAQAQAPPQMQPMYASGGIASAGGIPATTPTPAGGYWSHMVPPPGQSAPSPQIQPQAAQAPQGQAAPQMNVFDQTVSQTFPDYWNAINPSQGTPGAQPGLQMNVNDQGLSQSLPMPGAQQAQAPQQDFVGRLATSIAQAVQQVGLPQMSVVRPNNPRVPRALDPQTASAIRNEGVQQDFQRAQLANQTAQVAATTANTQIAQKRDAREEAQLPIENDRWNRQFNEEQAQTAEARAEREDNRKYRNDEAVNTAEWRKRQQEIEAQRDKDTAIYRAEQQRIDWAQVNKPSGGGGGGASHKQFFQNSNGESGIVDTQTGERVLFPASITDNPTLMGMIEGAAGGGQPNPLDPTKQVPADPQVRAKLVAIASKYAETMRPEEAVDKAIQDVLGFRQMWGGSTVQTGAPGVQLDANGKPIKRFSYSGNGSVIARP